jgi:hypothetical protein
MRFEVVEWDDSNLGHLKRATAAEVEQAIANADHVFPHRTNADRGVIHSETNGGRRLVLIVELRDGGRTVRPITAWEDEG